MSKDELRRLLEDDNFKKASTYGYSLKEMIDDYVENVKPDTVAKLTGLKEAVEKSYNHSRKARIAGTTATITGSVIAITGFGLSFVTLGASLGLTVAGAALAAAGGVTIGGAEVGYLAVSRKKLKDTEDACQRSNEAMKEIKTKGKAFFDLIATLSNKYPTFTEDNIFHLVRQAWDFTEPTVRTLYNGYKLIDGATDVGRSAVAVSNTVRAGVQAGARTAYVGLGTVGRVFSIGSVVLDVVFIPIDVAVLVKSAYDVHKYKDGRGRSNSTAASNIVSVIKQLEENEETLREARNHLPGAETDQGDEK